MLGAAIEPAEMAEEAGEGYIPLKSSFLAGMKYDSKTGELTVYMQSGAEYAYPGVSPSAALGLASASSPGRYYDDNIKLRQGRSSLRRR